MEIVGFRLYLIFLCSFFLHLPQRVPVLGVIRFDLLLLGMILVTILMTLKERNQKRIQADSGKILWILVLYLVISLPFVQWPGSVLQTGAPRFMNAAVFFVYTVYFINTEQRLTSLITCYAVAQVFRVLEPLYLHITDGYWGSATYMGPGEFLERLSGAPSDVINPNGLAFVIVSVLPFLHYLLIQRSFWWRCLYLGLLGALVYTLILTASRSGFLSLLIIVMVVVLRSKRMMTYISLGSIAVVIGLPIVIGTMTELQRDRYLSIYRHDVPGASTSEGRVSGMFDDFEVGMRRPIVGHGLGTSLEATVHATGHYQLSHTLYTEILQELGFIGLIIFLIYMRSIFRNIAASMTSAKEIWTEKHFVFGTLRALDAWIWMALFFSLASYGLTTYEWYFFGGLAVVVQRLLTQEREARAETVSPG